MFCKKCSIFLLKYANINCDMKNARAIWDKQKQEDH